MWLIRASNTEAALVARAEAVSPEALTQLTSEIQAALADADLSWSLIRAARNLTSQIAMFPTFTMQGWMLDSAGFFAMLAPNILVLSRCLPVFKHAFFVLFTCAHHFGVNSCPISQTVET